MSRFPAGKKVRKKKNQVIYSIASGGNILLKVRVRKMRTCIPGGRDSGFSCGGWMKRLFLIMVALVLGGCATAYQVRFNGYLDTERPHKAIERGASFCVLENKSAKNPILESEIKAKIEMLLVQNGYRLDSYEKADFFLGFNYSIGAGRTVYESMPVYIPPETGTIRSYEGGREKRTSFITYPGYTTYVPQNFTLYSSSLILDVFDAQRKRDMKEEKPVWIGETFSSSRNSDLREIIDFLLVAAFEHFGEDTGKSLQISVSGKNPWIRQLQ
jgi:hypothetical protein